MTWQLMDTAPKDGSTVIGHVLRAAWRTDPPRQDGPFIASVKWDGSEWVLADRFEFGATLTVNQWMPVGERI